jgi:hypothetical protein
MPLKLRKDLGQGKRPEVGCRRQGIRKAVFSAQFFRIECMAFRPRLGASGVTLDGTALTAAVV